MYEVEFKVEITEEEARELFAFFKKEGFVDHGVKSQSDHYTEVRFFPDGWYDFVRYRHEDNKYFCTEKIMEEFNGERIRKEIETEVAEEDFTNEVFANPNAISIEKNRRSFSGTWGDLQVHIDMDSVKFDHSENIRYFIEGETLTEDKEKVGYLRKEMENLLTRALGREIIEAPGMFKLAYEKL